MTGSTGVMNKSIVFVSIFDLTKVFFDISRALEKQGHTVSWVTTSEVWTAWLLDRGVPRTAIRQLVYDRADFVSEAEKEELTRQIVESERRADITVNQALLMDRFVLYKNKRNINDYMHLYYRDIKSFLIEKRADFVFAEPTNCNEMMTYLICREIGVRFLSAAVMRFPSDRMVIFDGYQQTDIAEPGGGGPVDPDEGRRLLEGFARNHEVPSYFRRLIRQPVVHPRKAARSTLNRLRLLRQSSRKNLTHHDLPERLKTAGRRIVNGFWLRHFYRYDDFEKITGRIAFYPLHVQPEQSVDVRGAFHSDQLKLLKDIRRSLPFDVTLVVKEHPNFLGQRGRVFFKQLERIPNTRIVPHLLSTFEIYKRADLVFTVTGTPAYEAGMLGIPAITFTRMFFDGLSSVHYCPDVLTLKSLIARLLDGFERDFEGDCRFMGELLSRSHPGHWTDPLFDARVMEPENLALLAEAFRKVVEGDSH